MRDSFDLGVDIGSVSVNLVVMNLQGEVLREEYVRHLGDPYGTTLRLMEAMPPEFPLEQCRLAA